MQYEEEALLTALAVVTAVAVVLATLFVRERTARRRAEELRKHERAGRIHAEQRLALVPRHSPPQAASAPPPGEGMGVVRCRPIGVIRSVFKQRNGTPRQSMLVETARACLTLNPNIDASALDGLADFSHCWVLFSFSRNTNAHKDVDGSGSGSSCMAKVRPPRLGGRSIGVFATRSPHHPTALGMSLARLEAVRGKTLWLRGLDVVDGTPCLDIKPYLSSSDVACGLVKVAQWVAAPERLFYVSLSPTARSQLAALFAAAAAAPPPRGSFFATAAEVEAFLLDALKHDIRSVHRRQVAAAGHSVLLDAFLVGFTINDAARAVTVQSIQLAKDTVPTASGEDGAVDDD